MKTPLSALSTTTRLGIVALCLVTGWLYLGRSSSAEVLPPREPLEQLPMHLGAWHGTSDQPLADDILAVLGVDDYIVRAYRQDGQRPIGLYVGFYESQRQGDTIHSPLNCLPGAGWEPLEVGRTRLDAQPSPGAPTTRAVEVNRVVIGKGLDRQLVLYWYQSRDRVVASEYWGKIYTVLDAVRYNRTDAALVRVIVPIPDKASTESADRLAREFAVTLFPQLRRHLPA